MDKQQREKNATWLQWTRAIFSLAAQAAAPQPCKRRLFTWPTGGREVTLWASLNPLSSTACKRIHLFIPTSYCLFRSQIKPWINIPNAEEESSFTQWFSSLPSTCTHLHHPAPPLPPQYWLFRLGMLATLQSEQRRADAYFMQLYMFEVIKSIIEIQARRTFDLVRGEEQN